MIEKLSVKAPSGEAKLKLMKEIAAEHNVDWDPAVSEKELTKVHEDLLVSFHIFLHNVEIGTQVCQQVFYLRTCINASTLLTECISNSKLDYNNVSLRLLLHFPSHIWVSSFSAGVIRLYQLSIPISQVLVWSCFKMIHGVVSCSMDPPIS